MVFCESILMCMNKLVQVVTCAGRVNNISTGSEFRSPLKIEIISCICCPYRLFRPRYSSDDLFVILIHNMVYLMPEHTR